MTKFEMWAGILGQRCLEFMEFTVALSTSANLWIFMCSAEWHSDICIALWFAKGGGGGGKAYFPN